MIRPVAEDIASARSSGQTALPSARKEAAVPQANRPVLTGGGRRQGASRRSGDMGLGGDL